MSDSNDEREGAGSEPGIDAGTGQRETNPADNECDGSSLPSSVREEAERLTRLARTAEDTREAETYRDDRESLLEPYEYTARVRDEDDAVLVLHPAEWHDSEEGIIRTDRITDLSRAVEIRLEGAGDPDDWDFVDEANRALVAKVRANHGDVHGDNAGELADFAGNHYAKRIEDLTGAEIAEFLEEYFVRNAWPSDEQRDAIEDSLDLLYETAGKPTPDYRRE